MNTTALDWQRIAAESGLDIVYHEETGSTSDDARRLAVAGAAQGTVVLSDAQTAGRGRRGAAWISPARRNLLSTVVLRPAMPFENWPRLTHACALAVCEALEQIPDLPRAEIKWPNDVYLSGRKVCGILVESMIDAREGFAVAGVGVNLNLTAAEFPQELRDIATSVWLERGGQPVSREEFAVNFLQRLHVQCARSAADFTALLEECNSRSFLNGKRVRLVSGDRELEGTANGAGSEGELRLVMDNGEVELVSSADFVRPA